MDFHSTHTSWDHHEVMAFPTPAGLSQVYANPMWGLKIDSVVADARKVPGQPHDVDLEDADFRVLDIGQFQHIYKVRMRALVFADVLRPGGDFELIKFVVPQAASEIRITYQLRTPNGLEVEAPINLVSRLFE